jgi:hypothetical protein
MKRMKYWIALCAALLIVFSARPLIAATDITGTWVGDLSTPDGNTFPLKFNFKQDGSKFTGTVDGPQGDPLAISDGKIDGDKITFTVTFNDTVIHHEGTIDGDQIKVSSKSDNGQMPPMQFTLKRSTDTAK